MAGRFAFQKFASGMSRSTRRLSARASASARAAAPVILVPRASEAGMGTISTGAAVDSGTALANNSAIHDYEDEPGLSDEGVWKLIWRLEAPPKVRVFWWRVMHEFLPARQILHGRHIERLAACEVCGADQETIRHVLLECTMAKLFWENTKQLAGVKLPHMHPETWARDLLLAKVCPRREAAAIICGMWALWVARDRRHHGEQPIQMQEAVLSARDTAFDLWQIMHKANEVPLERIVVRWKPPEVDWMKCNVDGAFNLTDCSGATGLVLRDHRGGFAGARARWHKHSLSALSMEAQAVREGTEFALDKGIRKLVVATDCLELVKLWELGDRQCSVISQTLADVRQRSRNFEDFVLLFEGRSCNRVAHQCAKLVSSSSLVEEWHCPPPVLRDLLDADW